MTVADATHFMRRADGTESASVETQRVQVVEMTFSFVNQLVEVSAETSKTSQQLDGF